MSTVNDHGIHVKVFSDNTTAIAIACINKFGRSHSELCYHITKQIWECAEKKDIQVTASNITGHKNINADRESRELSCNLEWILCPKSLHKALKILKFNPEADMFASNINYQFHTYFSYKADPKAKAMDSFTVSWHSLKFYAFPSPVLITSRKNLLKLPQYSELD